MPAFLGVRRVATCFGIVVALFQYVVLLWLFPSKCNRLESCLALYMCIKPLVQEASWCCSIRLVDMQPCEVCRFDELTAEADV